VEKPSIPFLPNGHLIDGGGKDLHKNLLVCASSCWLYVLGLAEILCTLVAVLNKSVLCTVIYCKYSTVDF
jgi:hypothetical protein